MKRSIWWRGVVVGRGWFLFMFFERGCSVLRSLRLKGDEWVEVRQQDRWPEEGAEA